MDGGKERKIEWSYPQVVFAAERLQQLLIVLVTHLSQKRQQTCHKFSLTTQHIMRRRRWSFNVVAYSGQTFIFLSFWRRNEFKKYDLLCFENNSGTSKNCTYVNRIFKRVSTLTFLHQTMMISLSSTSPFPPFQKLCLLV